MPAGLSLHVACTRDPDLRDISFVLQASRGGNLLFPLKETPKQIRYNLPVGHKRLPGKGQEPRFTSASDFNPSLVSCGYMLEEFCEQNHCDQYTPSTGGSFAKCLMMQRELSRVGNCPLGYDKTGPPGTKK